MYNDREVAISLILAVLLGYIVGKYGERFITRLQLERIERLRAIHKEDIAQAIKLDASEIDPHTPRMSGDHGAL